MLPNAKKVLSCLFATCAMSSLALADGAWLDGPYTLAMEESITAGGRESSGSVVMTLVHNEPCQISMSVLHEGDEVLSCNGDTLTTNYKLAGENLQNPDAEWIDPQTFLQKAYQIMSFGPESQVTLWVRATASMMRANEAGNYEASLVMTLSW